MTVFVNWACSRNETKDEDACYIARIFRCRVLEYNIFLICLICNHSYILAASYYNLTKNVAFGNAFLKLSKEALDVFKGTFRHTECTLLIHTKMTGRSGGRVGPRWAYIHIFETIDQDIRNKIPEYFLDIMTIYIIALICLVFSFQQCLQVDMDVLDGPF
jgi:hypothetical protein